MLSRLRRGQFYRLSGRNRTHILRKIWRRLALTPPAMGHPKKQKHEPCGAQESRKKVSAIVSAGEGSFASPSERFDRDRISLDFIMSHPISFYPVPPHSILSPFNQCQPIPSHVNPSQTVSTRYRSSHSPLVPSHPIPHQSHPVPSKSPSFPSLHVTDRAESPSRRAGKSTSWTARRCSTEATSSRTPEAPPWFWTPAGQC